MTNLLEAIVGAGEPAGKDPRFPHAPEGWTTATAVEAATSEGLTLSDEHWAALRGLQEYFAKHEPNAVNLREMHDALDEKFHAAGGIKRLYMLFPAGPIAQGCRLAGLRVPAGAIDRGFGSVA
ncbi:MAG TPA: TusE/DsrC/DsvC family sulfur relay protein [Casimicrobiaceae bacterium]|nr:TusE/DsrC/DsvC family sulfur relay protein [Casimicrobiaceae bacterium]